MNTRQLISLLLPALLTIACSSTQPGPAFERNGVRLPIARIHNAWFEALDRSNPKLHDELLVALAESRRTGSEVFILKRTLGEGKSAQVFYAASLKRGGADNLMSVNFATREFLFDHFNSVDGPTMEATRNLLYNQERIRIIKSDLGIFGIK
jgi:hypothetical protein